MSASQYALKSFLRQAPPEMLNRYFAAHGIDLSVPAKGLTRAQLDRLCSDLQTLDERRQQELNAHFRSIHLMASEGGIKTLVEEGNDTHHKANLAEVFAAQESRLGMVFLAFLDYPEIFAVASLFRHADTLPQSWRKRADLPAAEPMTDKKTTEALGQAISQYYVTHQGRGRVCQVDHYRRGDLLYWFAYPEDYPIRSLVYDAREHLRRSTQRPAFEVVFVYSQSERSLDTWVRGDKKTLADLQRLWLGPPPETGLVYRLQGLINRDFPLTLLPEDGVLEARVTRLRLRMVAWGGQHLTLEAGARQTPHAIYDVLDQLAAVPAFSRDLLRVVAATFRIVFRGSAGQAGPVLVFNVSEPDSCSLKSDPADVVAKKLLRRWGIDVSASARSDPKGDGRPAQRTLRLRGR